MRIMFWLSWIMLGAVLFFGVDSAYTLADESLVFYMAFEEGTGETTNDIASDNIGALEGDISWTKEGKYGNALSFDGSDDYVAVPDPKGLPDGNEPRSITAWIKAEMNGHFRRTVVDYGTNAPAQGVVLRLGSDNDGVYWGFWNMDYKKTAPNTWYDGEWHHIAATLDGQTASIYQDGSLFGQSDVPNVGAVRTPWDTVDTVLPGLGLRIGKWIDSPANSEMFTGIIDEVAIFNKGLSDEEVKETMKESLGKFSTAVFPSGKLATTWSVIKLGY